MEYLLIYDSLVKIGENSFTTVGDLSKFRDLYGDTDLKLCTDKGFIKVEKVSQPKIREVYTHVNPYGTKLAFGKVPVSLEFDKPGEMPKFERVPKCVVYGAMLSNGGSGKSLKLPMEGCSDFADMLDSLGIQYGFSFLEENRIGVFNFTMDCRCFDNPYSLGYDERCCILAGFLSTYPAPYSIDGGIKRRISRIAVSVGVHLKFSQRNVEILQNTDDMTKVMSEGLSMDKLVTVTVEGSEDSSLWVDGFFVKFK